MRNVLAAAFIGRKMQKASQKNAVRAELLVRQTCDF